MSRDEIGMKNVAEIKYSDIKKFYVHLIRDIGFKPNSMEIIHLILHPVFNVAVRDGFIEAILRMGVMAEIRAIIGKAKAARARQSRSRNGS